MTHCLIPSFVPTNNSEGQPTPNPRSAASNIATSLGTLSILPRELRDEIYRHVIDDEYYISDIERIECNWHSVNHSGLPTVTASKGIHQEILGILHAEAIFIFEDWLDIPDETTWLRDQILFINQIQNVGYMISLDISSDEELINGGFSNPDDLHRFNEFMGKRIAEPISFFSGTEVLRKSCFIELTAITPKTMLLLQSPFIDAMRRLTGFKRLTLKLRSESATRYCPRDVVAYIGGGPLCADHAVGFKTIVDAIIGTLEPSLGPSVIREAHGKETQCLGWNVTFHPRDYVSEGKNVKTAPSTLGDQ